MRPYYEHAGIQIFHGDARELIADIEAEAIITDPVWPDAKVKLAGCMDPQRLLGETLDAAGWGGRKRLAVQIGCDSDPRFLAAVPDWWRFFRVAWLEFARVSYKGRLLHTGDVAYLFGDPPASKPGQHVIPGRHMDCNPVAREVSREDHPCPRRLNHVGWIVRWWTETGDTVLDPFMGSGTTLLAAKGKGRKAVGIEIEERYCEVAANRLGQEVFEFNER